MFFCPSGRPAAGSCPPGSWPTGRPCGDSVWLCTWCCVRTPYSMSMFRSAPTPKSWFQSPPPYSRRMNRTLPRPVPPANPAPVALAVAHRVGVLGDFRELQLDLVDRRRVEDDRAERVDHELLLDHLLQLDRLHGHASAAARRRPASRRSRCSRRAGVEQRGRNRKPTSRPPAP